VTVDLQLITVGRVSVDLYANEAGASFTDPQTFAKSIGGSPTNVAVAAARLGVRAAVATKVGPDPLGPYVVAKLREFGVDTRYVGVAAEGMTPVVLAALDPPEDPVITFYRGSAAPDTTLVAGDVDPAHIAGVDALWVSACALAVGTTAEACFTWLDQRARARHTILDLDYRPTLWASEADATRAAQRAIAGCTVVVGNREECRVALGVTEPEQAADSLLGLGVELAIVKMGGDGVLLATPGERTVVTPLPVAVRCGLGAGDAFGGALVRALVDGVPLAEAGALANAAGALVATRLMCSDAMPTRQELDDFRSDQERQAQA